MEPTRCKYRGKDITTGEWRYGVPIASLRTHAVYIAEYYDGVNGDLMRYIVDPKTIGQYVGNISISDKLEPIEVWEGDRIKMYWQHDGVSNWDYAVEGVVTYYPEIGEYRVNGMHDEQEQWWGLYDNDREQLTDIEILGTKHDNPIEDGNKHTRGTETV